MKLEAVVKIPSTEDKWNAIHAKALQKTSIADLEILAEMLSSQEGGELMEQTPELASAMARWDEACMAVIAEQNIRFTIPEMDQLMEAE